MGFTFPESDYHEQQEINRNRDRNPRGPEERREEVERAGVHLMRIRQEIQEQKQREQEQNRQKKANPAFGSTAENMGLTVEYMASSQPRPTRTWEQLREERLRIERERLRREESVTTDTSNSTD